MWARISVNSSNIEENRAQIIYPLRVHFCTFLRPPRSYISELATAVFTQVLFVLSNHSVWQVCFTAKIVALKFVEMMLRKLQLWSLWRVAERNLSQSAYSDSCQPPWWWIIDNLCQSALCHKPIGGIWRDQKRKRARKCQSHDDKHLLEGLFHVETGPGYAEPSSLHTLWTELKHFATKELLGCPWGLVVFLMLALYTLKLLVEAASWFWRLCPTQESNQESERKFL